MDIFWNRPEKLQRIYWTELKKLILTWWHDDLYWETERLHVALIYISPEDFLIIWES